MEDKTPIAMLILLLILVIWFAVSADDQNSEGQPVQYIPAEVPKLPVLVKLSVTSGGVKIPFTVAVRDDDGYLVALTNKSEIILENGKDYELMAFNEDYWAKRIKLHLYLDFDCDCDILENGSVYLYKIVPVDLEPIIPPYIHYFNDSVCVYTYVDRDIDVEITEIYVDGHNVTRSVKVYDYKCFDFYDGIKNITIELPDYKFMNQLEFDRFVYR